MCLDDNQASPYGLGEELGNTFFLILSSRRWPSDLSGMISWFAKRTARNEASSLPRNLIVRCQSPNEILTRVSFWKSEFLLGSRKRRKSRSVKDVRAGNSISSCSDFDFQLGRGAGRVRNGRDSTEKRFKQTTPIGPGGRNHRVSNHYID